MLYLVDDKLILVLFYLVSVSNIGGIVLMSEVFVFEVEFGNISF